MPWAHKGGERLTQWGDQILFECDSFIARKHGVAHTNLAVAIADRCRHVGYFIAARLPLTHCAAETLERFEEERLDVVRLEATRLESMASWASARSSINPSRCCRSTPCSIARVSLARTSG